MPKSETIKDLAVKIGGGAVFGYGLGAYLPRDSDGWSKFLKLLIELDHTDRMFLLTGTALVLFAVAIYWAVGMAVARRQEEVNSFREVADMMKGLIESDLKEIKVTLQGITPPKKARAQG